MSKSFVVMFQMMMNVLFFCELSYLVNRSLGAFLKCQLMRFVFKDACIEGSGPSNIIHQSLVWNLMSFDVLC